MGVHRADGVQATGRSGRFTGIQAMPTNARLIRYAVVVRSAANDARVEVADESEWAIIVRLAVRSLNDLLAVTGGERVAALGLAAAEGSVVL